MVHPNYSSLLARERVAIIAPAGHGKTEAICNMVAEATGPQLVLTHTHAGVNALRRRMQGKGISRAKYSISTIASFCQRWCESYPVTGEFDTQLTPQHDNTAYFEQLYAAAAKILTTNWARKVLSHSYAGLFVDEYQDCTVEQHRVILATSPCFPVRILGDPMQGIFGWAGSLVDMRTIEFPKEYPLPYPWRWKNTDPALGEWIKHIREQLEPTLDGKTVTVDLRHRPSSVVIFSGYKALPRGFLKSGHSAVYLGPYEAFQKRFALTNSWRFSFHETQECKDLRMFGRSLDSLCSFELADYLLKFTKDCTSKDVFKTYREKIQRRDRGFSRMRKYSEATRILSEIINAKKNSGDVALEWLRFVETVNETTIYRPELWAEATRTIRYAKEKNISYEEAAVTIRNQPYLRKNYRYRCLASRTVLAKGLEFDVSIVDMRHKGIMKARDFYVAISRAKKKIVIWTEGEASLTFEQ